MQAVFVFAFLGCVAALPAHHGEYPASSGNQWAAKEGGNPVDQYPQSSGNQIGGNVALHLFADSVEDIDDDDNVGYFRSAAVGGSSVPAAVGGSSVQAAVAGPSVQYVSSVEDIAENYIRSAAAVDNTNVYHVDSLEDVAENYFRSDAGFDSYSVPQKTVIDLSQVNFDNLRSAGHQDTIVVPSDSGEDLEKYVLVGEAPSSSVSLGTYAATTYSADSMPQVVPIYREVEDDVDSVEAYVDLPTLYSAMRSTQTNQQHHNVKAEPTMVGNSIVMLLD